MIILLLIIIFVGVFNLAVVAEEDTTISEGESEVSVVVELFSN